MLILARRLDESIVIGDDITVTVVEIKGNEVRLCFVAPADVSVHREEVFRQIVEADDGGTDSGSG